MIRTLAFQNYRSLRELVLGVDRLTVITGANGVAKSSVYRGLRLICDAASGELGRQLARESGLGSALWAGPERVRTFRPEGQNRRGPTQGTRRSGPVRMSFRFADDDLAYQLRLGLPPPEVPPPPPTPPGPTLFGQDPEVKEETLTTGVTGQPVRLFERRNQTAMVRDSDGQRVEGITAGHGDREGLLRFNLVKDDGETTVAGRRLLEEPAWTWFG